MANQPASKLDLPVREGEELWTAEEIAALRAELEEELEQHREALHRAEEALKEILSDEGASGDAADIGSANFERDHEMTLAANAGEMIEQTRTALDAIDDGTYGRCQECGEAIGKGRLQVYPRAILCMACKQRQERR